MDETATSAARALDGGRPGLRSDGDDGSSRGRLGQTISNLVVHVYHEQIGRGPTKARTHIAGNLVIVVLEDTLTRAERTLIAHGDTAAVLSLRRSVQQALAQCLSAGVHELTGVPVRASLADSSCEPDVVVHTFVLDRALHEPSRAQDGDGGGGGGDGGLRNGELRDEGSVNGRSRDDASRDGGSVDAGSRDGASRDGGSA